MYCRLYRGFPSFTEVHSEHVTRYLHVVLKCTEGHGILGSTCMCVLLNP